MRAAGAPEHDHVLDGGEKGCGDLIIAIKLALDALGGGQILKLFTQDPGAMHDLPAFCRMTGHRLLWVDGTTFYIQRREG